MANFHTKHNPINLTWFDQYNQFARACSIPKGSLLGLPDIAQVDLGIKLVEEEWGWETLPAVRKFLQSPPSLENLVEVADGITDTIYVLCQLARALGIPLNECWDAVQRANMVKVGEDGTVRRREDGKILKPEGWKPPDIWGVLNLARLHEEVVTKQLGAENWTREQANAQEMKESREEWNKQQDTIERKL